MFGSCKPVEPSRQLAFIDLVAADVSPLILHYGSFTTLPTQVILNIALRIEE